MTTSALGQNQTGDSTESFESFISSISEDLLGYFLRRVAPREGAADCLSETLLVVWRKRESLPGPADERRRWVFGVAHNVLRNHRRSTARQLLVVNKLRDALEASHIETTRSPDAEALLAEVRKLKPKDQDLVLLVAWDGFSLADAAQIVGIKAPAARARYSRIRRRLSGES